MNNNILVKKTGILKSLDELGYPDALEIDFKNGLTYYKFMNDVAGKECTIVGIGAFIIQDNTEYSFKYDINWFKNVRTKIDYKSIPVNALIKFKYKHSGNIIYYVIKDSTDKGFHNQNDYWIGWHEIEDVEIIIEDISKLGE